MQFNNAMPATKKPAKSIFLIGQMGVGKSFLGQQIAQYYHLPFIDLDTEVEQLFNQSVAEIFATKGEFYFRKAEKKLLQLIAHNPVTKVISVGGGAPCFYNNMVEMNAWGTTVWLQQNPTILAQQLVQQKQTRPLLKDIPNQQLPQFLQQQLQQRLPFYNKAQLKIAPNLLNLNGVIAALQHV